MVPAMAPDTNPSARRTPKAAAVAITAIVDGPGVPITATASKTSVNDDCQGEENRCPVIAIPLERNDFSSNRHPALIFLFEHDLRANASRLSRGKTGTHFPDHALASSTCKQCYRAAPGTVLKDCASTRPAVPARRSASRWAWDATALNGSKPGFADRPFHRIATIPTPSASRSPASRPFATE